MKSGAFACSSTQNNNISLFSSLITQTGNKNQTINILAVDFQQNKITHLYSLKKHTEWVSSLSLNNSENLLLTCGYQETIIWKKDQDNKWKFMTEVIKQSTPNYPDRALFLKDDQYILFKSRKGSTSAIVYQQINQILLNIMIQSLILYPTQNLNYIKHLNLDQN
ncbi:unnamed protein product [Paramecium pentaurelia]|uniref:Uncharacterized protein n=1 Tax=Paramecium pentaurelia TaxID=43138 RepID=A0A8S1TTX3_9CILI|nr:unnamed protein product [Paramecium pentaurelia]CAD8155538.1 unnamed protein product [Paramecium pentaurelia]